MRIISIRKNPNPTLNQVLASIGMHTRPASSLLYGKDIINISGRVVYTGRAGEVWAWLHKTGRA